MPIEISTKEELKAIEDNMSGDYILVNDIDLNGENFEPIGHPYTAFTGTFNGQDYKIHNGTINYPAEDFTGLFAYVEDATIENVTLADVNVTGDTYVGGIVGYFWGGVVKNVTMQGNVNGFDTTGGIVGWADGDDGFSVTISDCYMEGNIGVAWDAGGIAGRAEDDTLIKYCGMTGSIFGGAIIGGIVGQSYSGVEISNCYATGTVSGDMSGSYFSAFVGGIVGICHSEVNNCFATGNVTGHACSESNSYVGGCVGYGTSAVVKNCFAIGNVKGANCIGGFVGYSSHGSVWENCFARGETTGPWNIGGFIGLGAGYSGPDLYNNCYATGKVNVVTYAGRTGDDVYAGGFGGWVSNNEERTIVEDCFWDKDTTGKGTEGKDENVHGGSAIHGEPKSTSQMKSINTFSAWNITAEENIVFDEHGWNENYIWGIGKLNNGYPFLWKEIIEPDLNIWVFKSGSFKSIDLATKISSLFKDNAGVWVKKGGTFRSV